MTCVLGSPLSPSPSPRLEKAMKELSKTIMCGICLDDIDQPVSLICSHTFCKGCLTELLKSSPRCPYCSRSIGSKDMVESSKVMVPIIHSVRRLLNNFFGIIPEETKQDLEITVKIEHPIFSCGDVINVAPRLWPGINKPGGAAWITFVHEDGTYDVKYVVGGGSDLHVPATYIRTANEIQEDRSQRTRRSKGRTTNTSPSVDISQSSARKKRKQTRDDSDGIRDVAGVKRRQCDVRESLPPSYVFLATTLSEDLHALLRSFCVQFPSCRIVTSYSDSVTHIIVSPEIEKERTPGSTQTTMVRILHQRTMKYLQGLLGGKWIISIEWIEDCLVQHKILREDPYEIDRDVKAANESHGIPRLSRINAMAGKKRLFHDLRILLHGHFPSPGPKRGDLEDLLGRGGASILPISSVIELINASLDGGLKVDRSKHTHDRNQVILSIVSEKESLLDLYQVFYTAICALRTPLSYDFEDFVDHLDGIIISLRAEWVFDCISNFSVLDPLRCSHRIHHT